MLAPQDDQLFSQCLKKLKLIWASNAGGDSSVVDHLAGPAVLPKRFNLIGKGSVASDASGLI